MGTNTEGKGGRQDVDRFSRADSAQTTETVLTSKWQKAQTDYEELVIYNYGCLTKRKERAAELRNGVAEVLEAIGLIR